MGCWRRENCKNIVHACLVTYFLEVYTLELSSDNWTSIIRNICGAFNKFPDFFVQAFKIVVDSWISSMLLLYILWDDWSTFMISDSNEQLQQAIGIHPTKAW